VRARVRLELPCGLDDLEPAEREQLAKALARRVLGEGSPVHGSARKVLRDKAPREMYDEASRAYKRLMDRMVKEIHGVLSSEPAG